MLKLPTKYMLSESRHQQIERRGRRCKSWAEGRKTSGENWKMHPMRLISISVHSRQYKLSKQPQPQQQQDLWRMIDLLACSIRAPRSNIRSAYLEAHYQLILPKNRPFIGPWTSRISTTTGQEQKWDIYKFLRSMEVNR